MKEIKFEFPAEFKIFNIHYGVFDHFKLHKFIRILTFSRRILTLMILLTIGIPLQR